MKTMKQAQQDFITARDALAIADKGYHDELTATGIQATLDAWEDGDLDPAVESAHDVIFAKWEMSKSIKAVDVTEHDLVWCLCSAIEHKSPGQRAMVATLREHIATTTRYDPKRAEMVALALAWKW